MRTVAACAAVVVMLMLGGELKTARVEAQQQSPGTTPNMPGTSQPSLPSHLPDLGPTDPEPDPMRGEMHEKMLRAMNEQRHKKMLDDANKMVQLANELKADVEKTQSDELSVQVIKKAAEVEKLAHDVQQRMKQ